MRIDGAIALEIKQSAIRDLDKGLLNDVGIGSGQVSVFDILTVSSSLQDPELQLFDHLRYAIDHLYFSSTRQRRH